MYVVKELEMKMRTVTSWGYAEEGASFEVKMHIVTQVVFMSTEPHINCSTLHVKKGYKHRGFGYNSGNQDRMIRIYPDIHGHQMTGI